MVEMKTQGDGGLTLEEVIDYALTYMDYPVEVLAPDGMDSPGCDMEPGDFELARATIAYMSYRLLLMERMKRSGAAGDEGGWVALGRHRFEVCEDIAWALGIRGAESDRIDETRRLYKVASKAWDEDEAYRDKIAGIMQDLEEKHGLDAGGLGIVLV